MKIQSVTPPPTSVGGAVQEAGGTSFNQVIKGIFTSVDKDLKVVTQMEAKAGQTELRDLMKCQVHAHQLHLKVELCAKVGESMSASIKRFQSGQ